MRITGSRPGEGIDPGNLPKATRPAAASKHTQTTDLLAISAAVVSTVASNGERLRQLKLEVDSEGYTQASVEIVRRLISGALIPKA